MLLTFVFLKDNDIVDISWDFFMKTLLWVFNKKHMK